MRVVPAVKNNSGGQRESSAARGVKFPAPVGRRRQRRGASGAGESAPALAPEYSKKFISTTVFDGINKSKMTNLNCNFPNTTLCNPMVEYTHWVERIWLMMQLLKSYVNTAPHNIKYNNQRTSPSLQLSSYVVY